MPFNPKDQYDLIQAGIDLARKKLGLYREGPIDPADAVMGMGMAGMGVIGKAAGVDAQGLKLMKDKYLSEFQPDTYYHGTKADFKAFEKPSDFKNPFTHDSKLPFASASKRLGIYLTKEQKVASMHVDLNEAQSERLLDLKIRPEKTLDLSHLGSRWSMEDLEKFKEAMPENIRKHIQFEIDNYIAMSVPGDLIADKKRKALTGYRVIESIPNFREILQKEGYDSIKFKDLYGNIDPEVMIMFNPEKIRSTRAEFDPLKKDSPELLSGFGMMPQREDKDKK